MKSKVLSIALTLIALFVFGSAQAQNLAEYTAVFNTTSGILTVNGKLAGLGANKRSAIVSLDAVAEVELICEKVVLQGNGETNVLTNKKKGGSGGGSLDPQIIGENNTNGNESFSLEVDLQIKNLDGKCPDENSGFKLVGSSLSFEGTTLTVAGIEYPLTVVTEE